MEHVAIMKKSWGLLPKLVSGQKTIESRWLVNQSGPWGKVREGETIYFKDAGEPVTVKATVSHVLELDNLGPGRVREILDFYGEDDGISDTEIPQYEALFSDKQYCVLIFMENIQTIEPFHIDKQGFGAQTAWISVPSVHQIKVV